MASKIYATLVDELTDRLDELSNLDPLWVTFVIDHKTELSKECTTIELSDADRDRYRNKFEHFLREHQCPANLHWVAILINDMQMYEDFTLLATIKIPNVSSMTKFYRQYRTAGAK